MIPVAPSGSRVTAFSIKQVWRIHCFLVRTRYHPSTKAKWNPVLAFLFYSFLSVEPHRPTGKIRCLLPFLVVINCPNCLSRCRNPSVERLERYLHSWSAIDRYTKFRHPNHREFTCHPWFFSEDSLYPPFQLNDPSLEASEVEKGSKNLFIIIIIIIIIVVIIIIINIIIITIIISSSSSSSISIIMRKWRTWRT